jgi:hypothetical protein
MVTRNVKTILSSKAFQEIFPIYARYYTPYDTKRTQADMFQVNTAETLVFAHTTTGESFHAFTRGETANGIRVELLIIEDLTKGETEADKPHIHEEIVRVYDNVWSKRATNISEMRILVGGTCWADFDLLNVLEKRVRGKQQLLPDPENKYTLISEDGMNVFITVPSLDYDTDKSTFEENFSTEFYRNERDNILTTEAWWARCQQRPLQPKSLLLKWDNLRTYESIPAGDEYYACLDPSNA